MHDPVDDDVPAGFLFELPAELAKVAPATPRTAKAPNDADEAGLQRAARVVAVAPPVSVEHGRPQGAGNALAFHAWRKDGVGDGATAAARNAPKK
jgi:hypothetical protein